MVVLICTLGLVFGFVLGCCYVLISRGIHKKATTRKNVGFENAPSIQLRADQEILDKSRVEESAQKFKLDN